MNRVTYYFGMVGALSTLCLWPALTSGEERPGDAAAKTADVAQAYCGLRVSPLSTVLTAQLANVTGKGRGVVVAYVLPGSPAEKAGLKEHDILITYDNHDVYSPEQLVKLVRNDRPGRQVPLTYLRRGMFEKLTLTLDAMPGSSVERNPAAIGESAVASQGGHAARERNRQSDPQPWAMFEALTITKLDDGRYRAVIEFRDADRKNLRREYSGSREEIRQAIERDKDLPKDEREHLLRGLDRQTPRTIPFELSRGLRKLFDLDEEWLPWPNLSF
jgi:hypothetical protein